MMDCSWGDDNFADDLPILEQAQSRNSLLERQHAINERPDAAFIDHAQQCRQVIIVVAVGTDHLQLETPDVAQIFLRIETRGRAADKQLAAALDASPSEVSTSLRRLAEDGFLIRGDTTKAGTAYEVTEKAKQQRPSTWHPSSVSVSRSNHYRKNRS